MNPSSQTSTSLRATDPHPEEASVAPMPGFDSLLHAIDARAAVLDNDFRIVATNRAWERRAASLGALGSATARSYLDVYEWRSAPGSPPRSEVASGLLDVAIGRADRFVLTYELPEKGEFVELRVTPIERVGPRYLLACLTDSLDRGPNATEVSTALRDARRRAMVAEQSSTLVAVADARGMIEWANQAFLRSAEMILDGVVGRPPIEVFPPVGVRHVGERLQGAITAGAALSLRCEHLLDGRSVWLQLDTQPVYSGGRLRNHIMMWRDVSELIAGQGAASEERQTFAAIVDSLPLDLSWKNQHLQLEGCNAHLRLALAGDGVGSYLGLRMSDIAVGSHYPPAADVEANEAIVLESGLAVLSQEIDVRCPDTGDVRNFMHSALPLVKFDGPSGVVSIVTEVTHLRTMERALAEASRLEAIGQLAAGVAHEINTPVQYLSDNTTFLSEAVGTMVSSVADLATLARVTDAEGVDSIFRQGDLEFLFDEIPSALRQSEEGLSRVAEIVGAMKDFSHPGGEMTDSDLNSVIQSTITVSRNEWKFVADMDLRLDDTLRPLRCHEGPLRQALLNLVVNAAHAIDDGHDGRGTITVSTQQHDDHIVIEVADTGCGMAADVQDCIFDQFFTTKQIGRGTGQGLAMARSVVQNRGGTIAVASTVGEGTTFTISLPMAPPT